MRNYKVGILGATGAVGQNYALLLENHPWFNVSYLAASPNSAGKKFSEAIKGKWFMDKDMPKCLEEIVVGDASDVSSALGKCDFVFSSYEGSKEQIQSTEMAYAAAGIPVVSNNSAHRWTKDVPMIIPEINPTHLKAIEIQKKNYGFKEGFIVTKPNCSIQSFMAPLYAIMQAGYKIKDLSVVTQQALSGAGYPGVPSLLIGDNIVPYISGEEDKTENEPLKIFGGMSDKGIESLDRTVMPIKARCTRVNVKNGHSAHVNLTFIGEVPSAEETITIFRNFMGAPQKLGLPSSPNPAIIYREELDRPQPAKDSMAGNGMAVTVGGLKIYEDGLSFTGLSHNTIRGAAGGAILTAELLASIGYLNNI